MRPLLDWFDDRGWIPFAYQREAWEAYRAGASGLVHAPTGTGKTLSVWGGPLLEGLEAGATGDAPLRVLWITPLRALAADTALALRTPLADLGLDWSVGIRTGDTSSAERKRQQRRLPTALITTPESLSVLLSYAGAAGRFRSVRAIVVDEWHELLGSKRGVQTELGIARVRSLAPDARVWGLSATLGNVDEAMQVLLGPARATSGRLVAGVAPKAVDVDTVRPSDLRRFPWAGHLGLTLLDDVIAAIDRAASTLVFTNTRSQAELWFQALLRAKPDWIGDIALHHGSIERAIRLEVEGRLRAGELKAVVCTSSLDLGVDFTPVDQVLQVGSPKGVARMLQRCGRSGHQPGATSRILGVPTHALELIEFAAARAAIARGAIEARIPVRAPLDVLAQHVVTMSLGDGFDADELLAEVRATHAYAGLTDEEWGWVLDFVVRGGPTLRAYPQYQKVTLDAGRGRVASPAIARRHRMGIGTITSDASMAVRFTRGKRLGTIEESFIARLKPGDRFVFAGRTVELERVRDMTAHVRSSRGKRGLVPRWGGGKSPLSTQLAGEVRRQLDAAREGRFDGPEMALVRPLLELQARWSVIPAPDELLVETTRTRDGHHVFLFTFAGRLVNEGLCVLVGHRITGDAPRSVDVTGNDYGIELLTRDPLPFTEEAWRRLLSPDDLVDDLLAALNASELARRRFRDVARVAGLILPGFPGERRPARHLQASSDLFFDVFSEFDPGHPLLEQARREVLDRELEVARMRDALERIARDRFVMVHTDELTPLGFPLWAERLRSQQLSSESWQDRVERMVVRLEGVAERETAGAGTT